MFTSSVWIIVTALLELGARLGSCTQSSQNARDLDYDTEVCTIRSPFQSPFVKVFREPTSAPICNYSAALSSSSSSLSSSSSSRREVHVVYLRVPSNDQSGDKHQRLPQVLVNIITSKENAIKRKDLVFVLASNQTISWKIDSDCINKARHVEFWVSNDSRIISASGPNVKMKKFEAWRNFQSFSQWVTEKFSQITRIKEYALTRKITISIGMGKGKACSEQYRNETPVEISGCVVPSNQGFDDKDVHIFELEMHSESSSRFVLDIHAMQSTASLKRHLQLVLKAHRPMLWTLRTSNLRGILDVITDQSVDTNGIVVQSVRVVNEHLANLSGADLIAWTSSIYGPPVSYTNARLATRFDLTVDAVDDEQPFGRGGKDDNSAGRSDGLIQKLLDHIRAVAEHSSSVSCLPGTMEVSLLKNPLSVFRLLTDQMSLNDANCLAQQNDTHYFWATDLDDCGAVQHHHSNTIVVENTIVIRPMKPSGGQSVDEFSGSGMKQMEEAEDDGVYDTFSDDEDVTSSAMTDIRLNFACTYPLDSDFPSDVDYYLRLYKDSLFQHRILSFPAVVGENHSLYVMAGIQTDEGLQANIENCSVFPADVGGGIQHPLIINRCIVDQTVVWKDQGSATTTEAILGERFEFHFHNWWGEHIMNIHLRCDLTVCNRLAYHRAGIPQCLPGGTPRCLASSDRHSSRLKPNAAATASRTLMAGPLNLHSVVNSSVASGRVSQDMAESKVYASGPEDDAPCSQIVRIEGLDSPTVVGIAFAAFLIGTLLSGTLWYIHSRTGPAKKRQLRRRSAETSGESTPSSTAPITICQTVNQV